MLPFSPTAADQIRFLLQAATDTDFRSELRELCEFADYGCEGSILLLQTCFDQIDFNGGSVQNVSVTPNIISAVLRYLLGMPNFSTVICEAMRPTWITESFPANLSNTLNLSVNEKLGIGLALSDSENMELRTIGQNFTIAQIEEVCAGTAPDIPTEQIQDIVMFLSRSEGLTKYVDLFTKMLSLLQQKESIPFVLSPLLPEEPSSFDSPRQLDVFYGLGTDFGAILSEIEKEMSMADILGELGYGCTADVTRCKEMLSLFLPLNEETISKILSTIVRTRIGLEDTQNSFSTFASIIGSSCATDSSCLNSWNICVLVDSIKQLAPQTNWKSVVENLDHEGFYIPDEEAFSFFMSFYYTACQDPFPLNLICGRIWKNVEGQLSFLKHAVCASPEVFTFANSAKKLPHVESIRYPSENGHMAWASLELLEILCQLAERGHASFVRKMIEFPVKQFPEALLIGMAHCHTAYNLLQYEVSSTVFPLMLQNSTRASVVSHLWNVNSNLVLRGILFAHSIDPDSITTILDLCQEVKILLTVLDSTPFSFSVKLAAVAARKECINLEQWLIDNLNVYRDSFFEICLKFLKSMLHDAATENPSDYFQRSGASMSIFQESFPVFFKVLQAHAGKLHSQKLSEEMKQFSSVHINSGIRGDGAMELSPAERGTDDVETEANAYFHQMFSGQLGIDIMVQMLARFKDSSDNRERKIFDCMISNLFEEYKFFPKYPERQLKIAAVLFGSLIKHQLVTHITLGIALRCVLDALRKSVDSKMFLFGAKALEQFMDRLIEWPQYCNHIVQISHLRSTHADLVSFIERALARISLSQAESNGINNSHIDQLQSSSPASAENIEVQQRHQGFLDDRSKVPVPSAGQGKSVLTPPVPLSVSQSDSIINQKVIISHSLPTPPLNATSGQTLTSQSSGVLRPPRSVPPTGVRQPSYSTGFGAALNIETLIAAAERRDAPIEAPPSEIQDKIFFMINNISATNLEAKSKEFTDILQEQYYPWFAQYMVMKRASIEPNFHDLYLKFLDKVSSRSLNKEIVKATYENCKVLLRSDLIKSSSEERSLLKNLGSWLGKFTIGRNQALRAREIDPKVLIIEAYEKGLMIAVIPFTSKILEPCQCSLAYQPPNPWTMAILSLLAEIYNLPNLKMNLKFDIEVLFKNLGVDLKDVKPTSLLKDRVREVEGNPDFSNKDISVPQPQIVTESNAGMMPTLNPIDLQHQVTSASHTGVHPSAMGQYTGSIHLAPSTQGEDDKLTSLSMPERVPSAQAQTQTITTTTQSSFSANQLLTPISSILPHIVVNSKLSALGLQMQLQRIIPTAIERAVREIISPVVQRSVTIATQTTKELVLKDYAMESDESRIRNAAHLMVSSLAGSLAHVTCKEPLRVAMSNHLRSYIQALSVSGELLEQAVQLVTNDNLDLGCAVIEQAATEKALQSIDGELAPTIAYRRKQRENSGSAYYDANTYSQGSYARVPEALRPKPGRLSATQQRVYEDFVKYPWHNQSAQNPNVAAASAPLSSSNVSVGSLPRIYSGATGPQHSGIFPVPSAGGFNAVTQSMELAPEEGDPGSAQILSSGVADVTVQQTAEMGTAVPFTPSTTDVQDMGAVVPSATGMERQGISVSEPPLNTVEVLDRYQSLAQKLETLSSKDIRGTDIQGIIAEVPEIIMKCLNRDEAALAIAQKVFKRLYENTSNSVHVSSHLAQLAAIKDVCKVIVNEITSWVIYLDEELKLNKDITIGFIRFELLNLADYDAHLAKLIDGGRNKAAVEFAISLIQILVIQEQRFSISAFENIFDTFSKLSTRPGCPESVLNLVEIVRSGSTNMNSVPGILNKEDKAKQLMEKKVNSIRSGLSLEDYVAPESSGADPAGFRDQVSHYFAEWYRICELPVANDTTYTHYISQLQQNGLLKGDDLTDRFFRILTEIAVLHCLASEQMVPPGQLTLQSPQQPQPMSFLAVDIYSKLVLLILKYHLVDQTPSVAILLSKIISVAVRVLLKDAEEKKASFNPRPYFRLFINFILDLTSPDALDGANFLVLTSLANAFHALQPLRVPGWSFAWLELVSHRSFMPKLLMANNQKGWPFFQRLLVELFKFMEPYLRNAELAEPVRFLYKGTLRMLLVLLHDFPEFLCDYHFSFCDVIPPSCIQMRNVILSAFPVNMRLPDPCTPNLKIDLLPEINQSPRILSDVDSALKAKQMKNDVDNFLNTRIPGSFLADLKQRLLLNATESLSLGTRYNVPLINSLVLYVGMQAVQQQLKGSLQQSSPIDIMNTAALELYQHLVDDLDTDGRYQFLNAIANQLRYPNNQTHYFSCILLFLFVDAREDMIREQITRVLLERLIVNRPHPWGLLITFIELIKNPRYSFWNQPFIHLTPDIEKLFDSVSRSCGASRGVDDGMVSGSLTEAGH